MRDAMTADYFCTGVHATPDEIYDMKSAYKTPYIIIAGRGPKPPEQVTHEYALAHGLPEIKGYYGCDFRDGEFIREKDALEGEPDSWGATPGESGTTGKGGA